MPVVTLCVFTPARPGRGRGVRGLGWSELRFGETVTSKPADMISAFVGIVIVSFIAATRSSLRKPVQCRSVRGPNENSSSGAPCDLFPRVPRRAETRPRRA